MRKASNVPHDPFVRWQPLVKVSTVLQLVAVGIVALCIGVSIGATYFSSDMFKVTSLPASFLLLQQQSLLFPAFSRCNCVVAIL